jgi:hypothetical protein
MPYGLKYFAEFNTISSQNLTFRLEISKKDYTGDETEITLTSTGCVQEWQEDNPFAPIKGCTLNIGIINDGTVSLDDFYSEEDDAFYVELIRTDTMMTLFRGYVLQDDSQEVVLDYSHELNIIATDNLGTLKSVKLNDAALKYGTPVTYTNIDLTALGASFYTNRPELAALKPGQQFTISGSLYVGTYTCLSISYNDVLANWIIYTGQGLPNFTTLSSTVTFDTSVNISGYVSLLTLVRMCLKSTNITCGLNVATKLYPQGGTVARWLDSTVILGSTFQNNDAWDSCYDVMEKIMSRFNASLFQTWGEWYIVRIGEVFSSYARDPKYAIEFNQYTDNFVYLGEESNNQNFLINKNDIETGLLKSIIRPYKSVTETFNYDQQTGLIKNTDLKDEGDLRNQYASGANTVYEYEPTFWTKQSGSDAFIRVVKDNTNKELSRELIVTGNPFFSQNRALLSSATEINAGSKISVQYDYKTNASQPGIVNLDFVLINWDGTVERTLRTDFTFRTGATPPVINTQIPAGDNTNQWHTFFAEAVVPYEGTFYFYLRQVDAGGGETKFRNIQFNATGIYLENRTIIGQTHTVTQTPVIKNSLSKTIEMDNAPSGIIRGALFINQIVNNIQQLASNWVVKCGQEIGKQVTFYTTSTEEPFGFVFVGCPILLNEGDTFTITDVNEFFDREWTVTGSNLVNGLAYVYVEGIEFGTSEGPYTGAIEYIEPDKVFTSFGEYSVKEQLFNFQKPRYKYNGTLLYINKDERTISNLSLFQFDEPAYNNLNIMPVGSIAIDYRNEIANFTMWALFEQLEDPWCDFGNFVNSTIYNFSYIYDIKQ